MSMRARVVRYSPAEEIANSITHGVGLLLAIAGLATLVAFAALRGTAWHIVGCSIFGATLVLSYLTSTLYHSWPTVRTKSILRIFDHCAIFLLIAGTYTPFMLVNLRGPWGWSLFGVVWGIATLGIVFKVTMLRKWTVVSVALYVAMGWVVVVATKPMLSAVAPGGLLLLLLGGLAYTGGVVFYAWRRIPYHHAVWHLFVLAGSVFHFFAVLFYVIPLDGS
jgi:hemolysin III